MKRLLAIAMEDPKTLDSAEDTHVVGSVKSLAVLSASLVEIATAEVLERAGNERLQGGQSIFVAAEERICKERQAEDSSEKLEVTHYSEGVRPPSCRSHPSSTCGGGSSWSQGGARIQSKRGPSS